MITVESLPAEIYITSVTFKREINDLGSVDDIGFIGRPGGGSMSECFFRKPGNYCNWWVTTTHAFDSIFTCGFVLSYVSDKVIRAGYNYKKNGFSIHCIHD